MKFRAEMTAKAAVWMLAAAVVVSAQSIRVVSEFQRIDPFGEVIPADRGASGSSREILSPPLARNAHSTFRIVVEPPKGIAYHLYIGENPENLLRVKVYKEIFEKRGNLWVPDKLEEIKLPYNGVVPEGPIEGQSVVTFLMDIWTPTAAPVRRMRVEAQMWIPDRWLIYPMEVRIQPATARPPIRAFGAPSPLDAPADASARSVWRGGMCGKPEITQPETPLTVRGMILRNARQDFSMAPEDAAQRAAILGFADAGSFCRQQQPGARDAAGPEAYLRLRDAIYRFRK